MRRSTFKWGQMNSVGAVPLSQKTYPCGCTDVESASKADHYDSQLTIHNEKHGICFYPRNNTIENLCTTLPILTGNCNQSNGKSKRSLNNTIFIERKWCWVLFTSHQSATISLAVPDLIAKFLGVCEEHATFLHYRLIISPKTRKRNVCMWVQRWHVWGHTWGDTVGSHTSKNTKNSIHPQLRLPHRPPCRCISTSSK